MDAKHQEVPRAPARHEVADLHDWLDDGLRRGVRGRLAAEYPLSMGQDGSRIHRAVFSGGRPVAHAMLHPTVALARGRRVPLGLIGNVYTDPGSRGRGLAGACVVACLEEARRRSLPLVVLWSELGEFYGRLGFLPVGEETLLHVGSVLERTMKEEWRVRPAEDADFRALEPLYDHKTVRAERPPGSLRRFAGAPDTRLVLAERSTGPEAYAALGRGDDFADVAHEWAGHPGGVLACLRALARERPRLGVLAGPGNPPAMDALRKAGAASSRGPFALARILDAGALWKAVGGGPSPLRVHPLGEEVLFETEHAAIAARPEAALEIFLGAGPSKELCEALGRPAGRELARRLPWPLYLWGFDSI